MKTFKLGDIIDIIGKSMSRIKTIAILILVVLFTLTLVDKGCNRVETERLFERITGLSLQNDILRNDIRNRDRLLDSLSKVTAKLKTEITIKEAELVALKTENNELEKEKEKLANILLKIPVDDSYKFLIEKAYPYTGEKRFPFNEPQVKGIHLTYLENIKFGEINSNLNEQIDKYDELLGFKDEQIDITEYQLNLSLKNANNYIEIIGNKDDIINLQKKEIKRKTVWGKIWKGAVFIGTLVGVVIGAGL